MEADDIRGRFESAINEAVTGAGARLDGEARTRLSRMATGAAFALAELQEDEQESAIDDGIAAYRKLVGKMVAEAKTLTMFPELNKYALDGALMKLGPEPPFIIP